MTRSRRLVRVAVRQALGPPVQRYLDVPSFGAAAAAISCGRGMILRFEWVDPMAERPALDDAGPESS